MKAETLKKAILQYAMQGKLVGQDPNDEPASVLLERIKAEKEQLIKDGKIKKEKPLSPISEDEIPYELPNGWEWVRLSDVCNIIMGQSPNGNSVVTVGDGIEFHQGKVFFGNKYLNISNQVTTEPTKIAEPNSILLCVRAPVGKVNITDRNICIGRGLCSIKFFIEISTEFLYYLLLNYEDIFVKQATGTTFVAITGEIVKKQVIPLPPLAEQERIVDKLEQILPLVEEYGKNEEKLSKLNSTLPDKIKQSILQHAVQGKLVPQNPNDEPASVLLKRIKAEKEQLIKDGKIKKEKPLPPITEGEIPYKLPKGWEWVRFQDVVQKIGSGSTPKGGKQVYTDYGIKFIRSQNVYNEGLRLDDIAYITDEINKKMSNTIVRPRDILLNITGGSIGRSCLIDDNFDIGNVNQHVSIVRSVIPEIRHFMHLYMISPMFFSIIMAEQNGISREGFSKTMHEKCLFPLPPLAEQQRIVTKVEELMKIMDDLK